MGAAPMGAGAPMLVGGACGGIGGGTGTARGNGAAAGGPLTGWGAEAPPGLAPMMMFTFILPLPPLARPPSLRWARCDRPSRVSANRALRARWVFDDLAALAIF